MNTAAVESAPSLLGELRALLERLLSVSPWEPHALRVEKDGKVAALAVLPPPRRGLTECERDIVGLIAATPVTIRLSTRDVIARLGSANLLHGRSTVKMTLARLVKTGHLISHRTIPTGYSLGPLMAGITDDITGKENGRV